MESEKMFDLMSKIYSELQETKKEMHEGFSKVDTRLNSVEAELSNVKNTVTNIEHTHGQKLEALFDGYTQNSQQLTRIEKEVNKHEEVILRRIK